MKTSIKISVVGLMCFAFFQCTVMTQKKVSNQIVTAEIIFYSKSGKNPLEKTITRENILTLLPDSQNIELVKNYFEDKQFNFQYTQGISATIFTKKEQFENLFSIDLILKDEHYIIQNSKNQYQIPLEKLPSHIQKKIIQITLPEKTELFY